MVTIFILCTGENWPSIASLYLRSAREKGDLFKALAQIYFLIVTVIGFIVLLSLFTALLLQNFDTSNKEKDKEIRKSNKKKYLIRQNSIVSEQKACERLGKLFKEFIIAFRRKFHGD